MAEYLDMQDQIISRRVENAMQGWERLAEIRIGQMHERLDAWLAQQQQRFMELDAHSAGMNPTVADGFEAFYGALDALRDDRIEYQEANLLALLERRLDGLYQAMDAQLPPSLEHLPETYEGHVDDALYRQGVEMQSRVDHLRSGEQSHQRSHEQGMGL